MANAIEILINAKDNASGAVNAATISIGSLAKAALASAGAFAAAQLSMQAIGAATVGVSKSFADEVEQLDRLRTITGLSNEQLQVFRRGLERNGLAADQLGLALRFFQNQLAGNAKELALYGITADDTFGALVQLRRALEGAGTDAERTELASKTLGMRNVELADTVTKVAANYKGEFADAMGHGAIMSAQTEKSMRGLDSSLDDFTDTVRAFKLESANMFGPMLKGLVDFMNSFNAGKPVVADMLKWNANGMMNPAMLVAAHSPTLPSGGPAAGDSEPFDQASWMSRYKSRIANGRTGADIVGNLGQYYSTAGPALSMRDTTPKDLMDLSKNLKEVDVPVLKLKDSFGLLREATAQFGYNLASTFEQTFQSLIAGTMNIRQAFDSMIRGIMRSISDAIVQMLARIAASYAVQGIGGLIGGPIGKAIGSVGVGMRSSAQPGGNTFIVQSISNKDFIQSFTSPTGALRGANDRMYDVAMAGSL